MVRSLSPVFDKNAHHWDVAKAIEEGADLHDVYLDRTPLEILANSVYTCEDLFQKTKLFLDWGVPLSRIKNGKQWSPLDEMNHHPIYRDYPISFNHHRASPFVNMLLERGAKLHQKPRIPAIALALLDKGYVFESTSGWFENWGSSGAQVSNENFEKLQAYGITPQETVEGEDRFVSLLKWECVNGKSMIWQQPLNETLPKNPRMFTRDGIRPWPTGSKKISIKLRHQ